MPGPLKIRAVDSDAIGMTDTAVTPANDDPTPPPPAAPNVPDGFFLDGDAPRLGGTPAAVPPRMEPVADDTTDHASGMAPAPAGEPVAMAAPDVAASDLPSLPTAPPPTPATVEEPPVAAAEDHGATDAPAEHPMAHMMPPKSKPSEAQKRAAEMRAAKKAKGKKIKIGVAIGALAIGALAGPPLVSWLSDALNEAGDTSTEE